MVTNEITSWEQVAGFALLMLVFWVMTLFTHFVYESENGEIITGVIAGVVVLGEVISFYRELQAVCQMFIVLGAIYMIMALLVFAVEMAILFYRML